MLWKKLLFGLAVSSSLMLPAPHAVHAQDQASPVEDQQPEDQQPEDQQPEDQQSEDQQPEDQQPEDQSPENQQADTNQSNPASTSSSTPSTQAIQTPQASIGAASAAAAGGIGTVFSIGVLSQVAGSLAGGNDDETATDTYSSTILGSYAAEYAANDALAYQNILSLNDYGYTGDGIRVSVVDSGIDASHQEFDGKTIYGVDFAVSPSSYDEDENGHGTHVASIIAGERDTLGMRGMAYDATLYSYKMDNDGDSGLEYASSDANIANIFNQHVTDNIHVSNNSWGSSTEINTLSEAYLRGLLPNTITAMRAAQNNGTIIIYASGNDTQNQVGYFGGLPYRIAELADEWLVVASVDSAGTEAYYSNRCGVAYLFCVTAVGGDLTTVAGGVYGAETGTNNGTNNNYVNLQGTSMATPHVSGLAAALMEKFPSLTPAQIVNRIKAGASYDGLTGRNGETTSNSTTATMQSIFGHGLINSTTSSAVIGTLTYAVGTNLTQSLDLSTQSMTLPRSLPANVQQQILKTKFAVFDSFDGARFLVEGDQIFDSNLQNVTPIAKTKRVQKVTKRREFSFVNDHDGSPKTMLTPTFMVSGLSTELSALDTLWDDERTHFLPSTIAVPDRRINFVWDTSYRNLDIHPFVETQSENDSGQSLGGFGIGFKYVSEHGLNVLAGVRSAKHTVLNGIFEDSAYSSKIRDAEFGLQKMIDDKTTLFARFIHSKLENIEATNLSFGFDNVQTNGWNIGYQVEQNKNAFVFGVTKPNEISGGNISFVHPVGRSRDGQIFYRKTQFKAANDNNFERYIMYTYDLGKQKISFGAVEDRNDHGKLGAAQLNISFTL